jgi:hypothetical protein
MKDKNFDHIARIEKAIAEKYGDETICNPKSNWTEEREKEYLQQMKEFYAKTSKNSEWEDKIDVNGIKVSKKLLNKEPRKNCPICGSFPKKSMDDVCLIKFECCNICYINYIEGREARWQKGWRPDLNKDKKNGNSI